MNDLNRLFWEAFVAPSQFTFPPYNIIQLNDDFKLEFAVAGFKLDELDVEYDGTKLIVSGTKNDAPQEGKYVHHGLANRNFKQTIAVRGQYDIGDVYLEDGILNIIMKDKTEKVKPKIKVRSSEIKALT